MQYADLLGSGWRTTGSAYKTAEFRVSGSVPYNRKSRAAAHLRFDISVKLSGHDALELYQERCSEGESEEDQQRVDGGCGVQIAREVTLLGLRNAPRSYMSG